MLTQQIATSRKAKTMTNERFTCRDYPDSDRMEELRCMYKTFDLRDKLMMINLLLLGENIEVFVGTLGKHYISTKIVDSYLNGVCIELAGEHAFNDTDLSDVPFIKSAIDEHNAQEKAKRKDKKQAKK